MKAFNQHNQSAADLYKFKEETVLDKVILTIALIGFVAIVSLI
jgi:hypothetical protein